MQIIYALIDPDDELPHYIGLTINLQARVFSHLNGPRYNTKKQAWIESVKSRGKTPLVRILEQGVDDLSAFDREKYWITYYLAQGAPLTNIRHNRT